MFGIEKEILDFSHIVSTFQWLFDIQRLELALAKFRHAEILVFLLLLYCSTVLLGWLIDQFAALSGFSVKAFCMRLVTNNPIGRHFIRKEEAKMRAHFIKMFHRGRPKGTAVLPWKPMSEREVKDRLAALRGEETNATSPGKIAATQFAVEQDESQVLMREAIQDFCKSNPLHFDLMPGTI